MKYYFSGNGSSDDAFLNYVTHLAACRLLSCHSNYTSFAHKWIKATLEQGCGKQQTIMLDSGAFTAWNKNKSVELEHLLPIYREFVEQYAPHFKELWLINLDKIPGSPGRDPDVKEIEAAQHVSDINYKRLVAEFGLRVLPVFHQGETSERLNEIEAMSDYICVSPRNDVAEGDRVRWARDVHARLPHGKATHGLATTGFAMMTTVSWTSVDSATWVAIASYGNVIITLAGVMHIIGVSQYSSSRYNAECHMDNLNPVAKNEFNQRIKAFGVDFDSLRSSTNARLAFSLYEIQYWVDNFYVCNFNRTQSLWDL